MTDLLRLACLDTEAPPLFHKSDDGINRRGYEPSAAELVATQLGRRVDWVMVPWAEMIPAVRRGDADAVWCGQGIIPERVALVDFTRPYAVFHESVLVLRSAPIHTAEDLRGRRVAAIAGSVNEKLANSFDGAIVVPFGGGSGDVFTEMLDALATGDVAAVVDDDVAFMPMADRDDVRVAFTAHTANRWGVGVAKDRPDVLELIDGALGAVIADGRLADVWARWMPGLAFPDSLLGGARTVAS